MGWPKGKPRKSRDWNEAVKQLADSEIIGGKPTLAFVKPEAGAPLEYVQAACSTCLYRKHNGAYHECRRFPPPWHRVEPNEWCGEHKS